MSLSCLCGFTGFLIFLVFLGVVIYRFSLRLGARCALLAWVQKSTLAHLQITTIGSMFARNCGNLSLTCLLDLLCFHGFWKSKNIAFVNVTWFLRVIIWAFSFRLHAELSVLAFLLTWRMSERTCSFGSSTIWSVITGLNLRWLYLFFSMFKLAC